MGNTCHCGHSRNCNKFWDNLMFGRCRCKRSDFHECCCKEKPKCECEKCHCKMNCTPIVRHSLTIGGAGLTFIKLPNQITVSNF